MWVCEKSFTWATSLRIHIKTIHEDHKDFKCEYCGKSFTQAVNLRVHMKTIHEDQKDIKCDSCGLTHESYKNILYLLRISISEAHSTMFFDEWAHAL